MIPGSCAMMGAIPALPYMAGLLRWFDASQIGLPDNTSVGTWKDLSSHSDLTQSGSGQQPILKKAIQNGLPVVRFDGSNDTMEMGDLLNTSGSNGTIFVMAKNTANSTGALLSTRPTSGSNGWTLRYNNSTTGFYFHTGFSPNLSVTTPSGFSVTTLKRTGLACVLYPQTGSSSSGTLSGYSVSAYGKTLVGSEQQGAASYFGGDIGEIIVYDSALADADRTAVANYLIKKWGT